MTTATNPETGEQLLLVGKDWVPVEKTATNDKGEKAYLVGGQWRQDLPPIPKEATGQERFQALISGMNKGLAGLAGLPMDTVENVYNLVKAGIGTAAGAAGRTDLMPELTRGTPLSSEWFSDVFNKLKQSTVLPRPDDAASRILYRGGVVAGGSMVPGARPASTAAAATGAAVAGEVSDNPLAPAVGAMIPGAAAQAGREVKAYLANGAPSNVAAFALAGANPSVGQATESAFFRGLENLVSKFPGGVGVMERFTKKQQADLGAGTDTGTTAAQAGRTIEKGITGEGGFLERTKATWQKLDADVAAKLPPNSQSAPTNTIQTLDALTSPVQGAQATTGALVNPKLAEMKANFAADLQANNGQIPYEALRAVRSRIGSMLDDALVTGIPGGELKRVYGALSKDMEAAANAAGAGKEFARQNAYYSARMDRIEGVLDRVLGSNRQPEDIFKLVNPTNPDQAGKLTAVMRSLKPEERQVVTEAIVNRMGRASPGRQDASGDVFSSETFLTNWNRMSDRAKEQVFSDSSMRDSMDALAKVSENIRTGSKVFQNPSGTAGSFAAYSVYSSPLTAIGAGMAAGPAAAAGVVGAAAGSALSAYGAARLMTSPEFVRWLADSSRINAQTSAAHLARLGVIYNEAKDEGLKGALSDYLKALPRSAQSQ